MSTVNKNVRSANRVKVFFNNLEVGLVQSVRMNDDYGPEPASGIGDIHVTEYVPTMARHSLNVQTMILSKKSMRALGISLENGDAALQGLVFDIVSYDKDTGDQLRKYVGCSYASGDMEFSKHSIVMESAMFNALDVVGTAS